MGDLSVNTIKELTNPNSYTMLSGDGRGLYIQVKPSGRKSWVFRYKVNRKTHWFGLGPFPDVPPDDAREAAGEARKLLRAGKDPLVVRQEAAEAEAAAVAARKAEKQAIGNTFAKVAALYIAAKKVTWTNPQHAWQWSATIEKHAVPIIGHKPVRDVDTNDVLQVLEPVWAQMPETASRLRGRIEAILDYAKVRGWRTGDNPALWRGHLKLALPSRAKVAAVVHHAALPWSEIAAFMVVLDRHDTMAAKALRFTILTAGRTTEVLNATWGEIALDGPDSPVWTVPAKRMKAGKMHRVPLSEAALGVLREVEKSRTDDGPDAPIFPGQSPGKPLSNTSMLMLLRRMDRNDLTSHGFRSSFRDWVAEATTHQREIAEAALAHAVENKVEGAYQRGDLLAKRRDLMNDWARYCYPPAVDKRVVPMRKRKAA
jgi:integrase